MTDWPFSAKALVPVIVSAEPTSLPLSRLSTEMALKATDGGGVATLTLSVVVAALLVAEPESVTAQLMLRSPAWAASLLTLLKVTERNACW